VKHFFINSAGTIKSYIHAAAGALRNLVSSYYAKNRKDRTRMMVLFITLLILVDYLMFCYHTDKNIFNIFPSIPPIEFRNTINVYVPDATAQNIMKETRRVQLPDSSEDFAGMLFQFVVKGSHYDNTSHIVPVRTDLRKVWIFNGLCVFDLALAPLKDDAILVAGAQEAFKSAVEKTVCENISSVKHVEILVNGIPGTRIW